MRRLAEYYIEIQNQNGGKAAHVLDELPEEIALREMMETYINEHEKA
ncbi:MAG: hypothetical protein PHI85_04020 [Victivallaceae bacterium]|nr:hypothetical protein [Victivallaceae bacterium]